MKTNDDKTRKENIQTRRDRYNRNNKLCLMLDKHNTLWNYEVERGEIMIIVSQDKTKTTDSLNLRIDVIAEEKGEFPNIERKPIGYCIVDKKYSTQLGTYETEERAKEVLQEIIKQKAMFELFRTMPAGGDVQTEVLERFEHRKIIFDAYEMPED